MSTAEESAERRSAVQWAFLAAAAKKSRTQFGQWAPCFRKIHGLNRFPPARALLGARISRTEELTMQRITAAVSNDSTSDPHEYDLHVRICAEFAEMPGLKLTLPQASRLFDLDTAQCERALDRLVASGSLARARGMFIRAGGSGA
jgi:hypothetical protein